jgi:hypothetical protein
MKTKTRVILTTALALALLSFDNKAFSQSNGTDNPTAQKAALSTQQITNYLNQLGYTVLSISLDADGSGNYAAVVAGGQILILRGLSIVAVQNLPN